MYAKRIIPCLDVKDGRVVKGTSFVNLRDAGDPVECAKIYDKRVKYFRDQGVLDLLKSDFSNGVQLFGGDLTVGKMFLFGKNTGMIVMFQEITRFFIHVHTTEYESGRTPTKKFELKFVAGNKHYVLCKIPNKNMNTSEWNQFCNFISLKNPNIILDQHMEMTRSCVDDTVSNDD